MYLRGMDIEQACREVLADSPQAVEMYRQGKGSLGFLTGRVIAKHGRDTFNPKDIMLTLRRILESDDVE